MFKWQQMFFYTVSENYCEKYLLLRFLVIKKYFCLIDELLQVHIPKWTKEPTRSGWFLYHL